MSYPDVQRKRSFRVAVAGANGYTGSELVRLLTGHPDVSLAVVTSRSQAGKKISEIHPQLRGCCDMPLQPMEALEQNEIDLVFLALPHAVSMEWLNSERLSQTKVVDLSADFRISSAAVYEEWYGRKHLQPRLLKEAVYGLPEVNRDEIRRARLIANPGCYPTSAILALWPLLKNNLIDTSKIVIDSKSGVSGAGAKATDNTHFPSVFGNFSAYGLLRHRHTPEIEQLLSLAAGQQVEVLFTPHLLPIDRGILTTCYCKPTRKTSAEELRELYGQIYWKEQFVRVCDAPPAVKNVRGSNFCDVFVTYDSHTDTIVTISVLDNLVKGAAGQAIQNMNIIFNMVENSGLTQAPLSP